ncbi:MAG: 50S ribosomal protein L9 [Cyanobacteriota bacterium]
MKVILTKDVTNLGETGDIVNVADGFARNYLLPSNFAEKATDGALKRRDQNLARIKAKAERLHKMALQSAETIKAIGKLSIQAKAGETGKLYGAITTRQLAKSIKEKTDIDVDRKNITLNNPINQIGEYELTIKLTSKVSVQLPIDVTADIVQEPSMTDEFKKEMEEIEQEKEIKRQQQQEQYKKAHDSEETAEDGGNTSEE